jgi:hypothetical protein
VDAGRKIFIRLLSWWPDVGQVVSAEPHGLDSMLDLATTEGILAVMLAEPYNDLKLGSPLIRDEFDHILLLQLTQR